MENINLSGQSIKTESPAPVQNNINKPSEEVIFSVLSYLPFLNIVIFIIKDDNEKIKFHARQGLVIFALYIVGFLPVPFIDIVFSIVAVIATLVGASKAYRGEMYKLPFIYDLSTKLPFLIMKSLAEILANLSEKDSGKYLKHEWQLFGYKLAFWLGDMKRISFYMKLAKNEDRVTIQKAWDFVKESKPKSRAGLFLWKLKELKKEKADKEAKKEAAKE